MNLMNHENQGHFTEQIYTSNEFSGRATPQLEEKLGGPGMRSTILLPYPRGFFSGSLQQGGWCIKLADAGPVVTSMSRWAVGGLETG